MQTTFSIIKPDAVASGKAGKVLAHLEAAGFRVKLDDRSEKIGAKIRDAQLLKVPFMLVLGDRETADETVAVRTRRGGDEGALPIEAFLERARSLASSKSNEI